LLAPRPLSVHVRRMDSNLGHQFDRRVSSSEEAIQMAESWAVDGIELTGRVRLSDHKARPNGGRAWERGVR